MTAATQTTIGQGLRFQRQWDVHFSTSKHFADTRHKAAISTGITVEYAVHTSEVPGATHDERLVLIMGFRQSMEWWTPLIEQLIVSWSASGVQKNLKILTFDNRGIGGSDSPWTRFTTSQMAEDTLALMDHLSWTEAHISGISMGGMICQELALLAPTRVKTLSLLSTTRGRFVSEASLEYDGLRSFVWNTNASFAAGALTIHPPEFLAMEMEDKDITIGEQLRQCYVAMLEYGKLPTISGVVSQAAAIATHFVSDERLAMINKAGFPVLILGGQQDRLIPVRESKKLAEHMKGSHVKLVILEDAGHGIFVEYLHEVTQEILSTMREAMH